MFDVNIISTGSKGNYNIIDGVIAIDVGVRKDMFLGDGLARGLDQVLISHEHGDHINAANIRWLYQNRPSIFRHGLHMNRSTKEKLRKSGKWSVDAVDEIGSIIDGAVDGLVLPTRKGNYVLRTYPLEHNVENQGFILTNPAGETLIHATDTMTMRHAPDEKFDALMIEGNWDMERWGEMIEKMDLDTDRGLDAYRRAMQNLRHLSVQSCQDFLRNHSKPGSVAWQLHESDAFGVTIGVEGLADKDAERMQDIARVETAEVLSRND